MTEVPWWTTKLVTYPWNSWFWAYVPDGWPAGWYWFFKIPPSGGHQQQIAYRSLVERWFDPNGAFKWEIKPDVIYILTYPGDTPNWEGSASFIDIGAPCGNWNSDEWMISWTTRNQTIVTHAAIRAVHDTPFTLSAIIATPKDKNSPINAYVQGWHAVTIAEHAAISGNPEKLVPIHATVKSDIESTPTIVAWIAKDFDSITKISSYESGNPLVWSWLTATILGETEISVGITALVMIDRTNQILIEMENLGIQERDLRSIPNWASKTVDWRKTSLEQEYGV
jgi:hypothetical protein